jgi:hypothetical protein
VDVDVVSGIVVEYTSVVTDDVDVIVVVVSDFFGAKTTNFNISDRVIATIIRTIREIPMSLTRRFCHH